MKNLVLTLTLLISSTAFAEDVFRPYVGIFTGFNTLDGREGEARKNGFNIGAKGTGSYLTDNFIFDASLGWQHNQMSGSINNKDVTVKTWSTLLDLDAKYRLNSTWSLGPVLQTHFGTDHTYQEFKGDDSVTTLAGLRLGYDTKWGSLPFRVEAETLTNITSLGRQNIVANVGISIGFDVFSKKKATTPRPVVYQPVKRDDGDVKITLKFARVNFQTDKFVLDSEAKERLFKLGQWLSKNPHRWGRLKISGHTDIQGTKEYNQRLSQDRADSVLKVFIEAGVDEKNAQAVGYGFSQPVDPRQTPQAWEKNRRTEIEFFDVKDREDFNKKLLEFLK